MNKKMLLHDRRVVVSVDVALAAVDAVVDAVVVVVVEGTACNNNHTKHLKRRPNGYKLLSWFVFLLFLKFLLNFLLPFALLPRRLTD